MDSPNDPRTPLLGLDAAQMRREGPLRDLPPFRSRQVARWLYAKGETRFAAMTDIARPLRETLDRHYTLEPDPVVTLRRAEGDEACKLLLRLEDGQLIETVLIETPNRRTICLSSQVGCAFGCTFCATARMGPGRNLTPREILSQLLVARREMRHRGLADAHNVVFMGMGEPLSNLDHLLASLRLMQDPQGLAIGWRRITVSTVGLEPQIRKLADSDVQVRLAFSLSATTDEVRSALMPVNRKYPFRKVFAALQEYQRKKRIRTTLEYVLLRDVNDSAEDARRLAAFARELRCKINLIVYNPHPAAPYQPSEPQAIERFVRVVYPIAPTVTLRYSKGRDILAACGQLSTRWQERTRGSSREWNDEKEPPIPCQGSRTCPAPGE